MNDGNNKQMTKGLIAEMKNDTIAMGIPIGDGLGVALGLVFHNPALGIIGISLGLAIAVGIEKQSRHVSSMSK